MSRQETHPGTQDPGRYASTPTVGVLDLACECGRRDCRALLEVSVPTVEWARARGLIVLLPGHASDDDAVVERTDRFLLVRPRHL